ncbi:MAG TPA: lipid-binding SYLF domain-containing protein [Nitrospira sp.]|jgi:lipid-binding SYLF domain-containing protein
MSHAKFTIILGLFAAALATMIVPDTLVASTEQQQLVDKAKLTVEAFAADPQQQDVRQWVAGAKGVFIVPQILRGAFVFGGAGGGGVLLVRDEKSGDWSQPAFYNIGAVSFGLQAGGDASELMIIVRTQKGLEEFYRSDFKLGADVGVAIGPLGSSASMGGISADLVSFGRSKGAFMGMALDGSMIAVSDGSNAAYYGKIVRPTDIVVKKSVSNPASAELRRTITELSAKQ